MSVNGYQLSLYIFILYLYIIEVLNYLTFLYLRRNCIYLFVWYLFIQVIKKTYVQHYNMHISAL